MVDSPRLVLASTSPRRRQLLALGAWRFQILPVEIDETPRHNEEPAGYAMRMATEKALSAAGRMPAGSVVIAADTTVADQMDILGKPEDDAQALTMLRRLRGRTHQVHTAIAVLTGAAEKLITDLCTTEVPMRLYTDAEMRSYVASGDPFDKAGGYAIQHPGFRPVVNLDGCYANVMGLPICHLVRTLRKLQIEPQADVPRECQHALQYDCAIHPRVLAGET